MSDRHPVVDTRPPAQTQDRPPPRRRVSKRLLGVLALLVAVLVLAWAAADAFLARNHLVNARDRLTSFAGSGSFSTAAARRQLTTALADAAGAASLLAQPPSVILRHIPLLGRSWVAEDTVAQTARSVLAALQPVLRDSSGLGSGQHLELSALDRLHADLASAAATVRPWLSRLSQLDTGLTPGPVGSAVAQAQSKLLPVGPVLTKAAAGTAALAALLGAGRPHTILIVLQNNAELRGTGGLIGSYAVAHSRDGELRVAHFHDADSIEVPADVARQPDQRVPAPSDYTRTYGPFLANSTLLKNANFSPSVPDVARVLSEVIAKRVGIRADAVMFFDAPAVASLVQGAGVTVRLPDGTTATGDDLVRDLLVSSYQGLGTSEAAQQRRHLGIERAADTALKASLQKSPSYALLRAFAESVGGRHIAVWSDQPDIERDLTVGGAAGNLSLPGSVTAMATADNLGDPPDQGNKLDYYAHRTFAIRAALSPGKATVEEKVTVHNDAPAGLGAYVEGPHHPGRLSELWSLLLPANARVIGMEVDGTPASAAREPIDGQSQMLVPVITQRGATSTITLEYSVPLKSKTFRLTVIPQPLALPAQLSVRIGGASSSVALNRSVSVQQPLDSTPTYTVRLQ